MKYRVFLLRNALMLVGRHNDLDIIGAYTTFVICNC
jgi:hypothetical protein